MILMVVSGKSIGQTRIAAGACFCTCACELGCCICSRVAQEYADTTVQVREGSDVEHHGAFTTKGRH